MPDKKVFTLRHFFSVDILKFFKCSVMFLGSQNDGKTIFLCEFLFEPLNLNFLLLTVISSCIYFSLQDSSLFKNCTV